MELEAELDSREARFAEEGVPADRTEPLYCTVAELEAMPMGATVSVWVVSIACARRYLTRNSEHAIHVEATVGDDTGVITAVLRSQGA